MRIILAGIAVAVGAASLSPIADALDTKIVGGAVPTRAQDLIGYLAAKPGDTVAGQAGPFLISTPDDVTHLRELAALSIGGALAVGALVYAVLSKVLR